jgi:hypothetical protein
VYHHPVSVDLDRSKRRVLPFVVHAIARLAPRQGDCPQFARAIHRGVGHSFSRRNFSMRRWRCGPAENFKLTWSPQTIDSKWRP